jgi:2-polyprenyl-3-methyl-5-hydroxy-6-metoxy-1,4-benzoquinol methylase
MNKTKKNKTKKNKTKKNSKLTPCIICKKSNFEKWAKLDEFMARKCKNCGMISINPLPEQYVLDEYYKGYFKDSKKNKKLWEPRKVAYEIDKAWITKYIQRGNVLDIGSSGGQFLSIFEPSKWNRLGVEVDADTADFAKKNFGVNVRVGNIMDLSFNKKFDLIIIRGVIEHFIDPISILKKCSTLLKKGGCLFITATPVSDSFAFEVYREKWRLFTPPGHLHFFTVSLLSKIVKKYGLELLDHHYQYQETPYANTQKDFKKIKNDLILFDKGLGKSVHTSPPFPGSMMTAVWKKI